MAELLQTQPGDYIALFEKLIKTGLLGFGMNELAMRSLVADPPKFVLEGVLLPGHDSVGAWSARIVVGDSVIELALIQFKKDERTRGRDDVFWGEWTIHIKGQPIHDKDDGMRLVFLATHDYVWIKGISPTPYPVVPSIELPPPPERPPEPEDLAERIKDVEAMREEFAPMELDEDKVQAYLQARSTLKEFHNDNFDRAGEHSPQFHREGRPY